MDEALPTPSRGTLKHASRCPGVGAHPLQLRWSIGAAEVPLVPHPLAMGQQAPADGTECAFSRGSCSCPRAHPELHCHQAPGSMAGDTASGSPSGSGWQSLEGGAAPPCQSQRLRCLPGFIQPRQGGCARLPSKHLRSIKGALSPLGCAHDNSIEQGPALSDSGHSEQARGKQRQALSSSGCRLWPKRALWLALPCLALALSKASIRFNTSQTMPSQRAPLEASPSLAALCSLQIKLGSGHHLLLHPAERTPCITSSWLTSLQDFLARHDTQLEVTKAKAVEASHKRGRRAAGGAHLLTLHQPLQGLSPGHHII